MFSCIAPIFLYSCRSSMFIRAFIGMKKPRIEIGQGELQKYYRTFIESQNTTVYYSLDTPLKKINKNLPLIFYVNKDTSNGYYRLNCFEDMASDALSLSQGNDVGKKDSLAEAFPEIMQILDEYSFKSISDDKIYSPSFANRYVVVVWVTFLGDKLKKDKYLGSLNSVGIPVYIFNLETVQK